MLGEERILQNKEVQELVQKMTLEEKVGQLIQFAKFFHKGSSTKGPVTGPMEDLGIDESVIDVSGSVLGAGGAAEVINIQKRHLENDRLGIPMLMMADVIHGFKTIFPIPLALGSSWDLDLVKKSSEIAALEASVAGVHITFSPMVDLVRDPRWGRVMESTGEDTFLNGMFAKALIRGYQGHDGSCDFDHVASCVKHFAAYGAPEGGRDYNTVNMSERQLRELYLPAYKEAVNEGCDLVMTAFNTVDGIPATGNQWLMDHVLREEWGFSGVVISDYGAVKELVPHGVAANEKEAALKSLHAGVDIEMMSACYSHYLRKLVNDGEVSETDIDSSVHRILQLKNKLGLFENPYRGADATREEHLTLSQEHREAAYESATKSCVLLKNHEILPLQTKQKIALIGPFAKSHDIFGSWSWGGSEKDVTSLETGIKNIVHESQCFVAKGCDIHSGESDEWQHAWYTAEKANMIVLALGEKPEMSGEAGSRSDIRLPAVQRELLKSLRSLGKPIIVVLFNGRPLDLRDVVSQADAVLEAWYPGTEGGSAVADLLYGIVNPSGKVTMSFPYSVGQIPVYYNRNNTGRPKTVENAQDRFVSKYLDAPNEALFPFGYGLSYTTFSYQKMVLSSQVMYPDTIITASVNVKNTGDRVGEEVVQLYIRDHVGEVVRPVKELKDFAKVYLSVGEEKVISFTISESQLRYYHTDLSLKSDPGLFSVFIGPNSQEVDELTFSLLSTT